jgi:hypothetical protein
MVHITCDVCGKQLEPGQGHHVMKIEMFMAHDPAELTEADLDADHMDEVSQLLEDEDVDGELDDLPPATQHFRYDLCGNCRRRLARDPLNKDLALKFDFSEN